MNTSQDEACVRFTVQVQGPRQTLQLNVDSQTSIRLALDTTSLRVRAACGGLGTCGACLIQTVEGSFNSATLAERQKLLPEAIEQGFRLACQLKVSSDAILLLEDPAPPSEWKSLDDRPLLNLPQQRQKSTKPRFGIAVDLGTSCIRLSVWNHQTGQRIGSRYALNPQLSSGSDVLTRLNFERQISSARVLSQLVRDAIISGVRDILSRDLGEISPILKQIDEIVLVGNTAMLTLICQHNTDALFDPANWEIPIACHPNDLPQWLQSWQMPNARLNIVQPLAGFIGSDLSASIIASGMLEQAVPSLLADFGTNTEMALWDGTQLWITSVPGGPAFEGMGMRFGMLAESGAINQVMQTTKGYQLTTIENTTPRGFCATGLIDAIALLVKAKVIKPSGRFGQGMQEQRLDSTNPYTTVCAQDIDLFQRAKASTAAAMLELCRLANISVSSLENIWICGILGTHLSVIHAVELGLLPPIAEHHSVIVSNASLHGTEILLLSERADSLINSIVKRAKVINLTSIDSYENCFVDNLRLCPMC